MSNLLARRTCYPVRPETTRILGGLLTSWDIVIVLLKKVQLGKTREVKRMSLRVKTVYF